jgi:oligoendopeptidase F
MNTTRQSETTGGLPARSELDPAHTWDLERVFATDADWEARFAEVAARLPDLERHRDTIGDTATTLLTALQLRDRLLLEIEPLHVFADLRAAEDQTNARHVAMADRVHGLLAQAAAVAWHEPAIVALGAATIERYLAENGELAVYRHYFDKLLCRQTHVRSDEVEEVLALATDPLAGFAGSWRALTNADLTFEPFEDEDGNRVPLQQNGQYRYLTSPDRRVRQDVWERYHDACLRLTNAYAANYSGEVKRNVFDARARRYDSALAAALAASNSRP